MHRIAKVSFITIWVLIFISCSMFQNVQQARDIIQADNELAWILMEVRHKDPKGASRYLTGLASHAEDEAKKIVESNGSKLDAISYYRIAATAYWRSGSPDAINSLFNSVNCGRKLCKSLGDDSPDRDCLFLGLVIPLAGMESYFKGFGATQEKLEKVDFSDSASAEDITTMNEAYEGLKKQHDLLLKIKDLGSNPRLKSHPGMCKYYIKAGTLVVTGYNNFVTDFFLGHTQSYRDNIGEGEIVNYDDALKLRIKDFPTECGRNQP